MWGITFTMQVTVGNVGVLVGLASAVIGAAHYWGSKILGTQKKLIYRYDLFLRIAADYYKRTGNNMAIQLVKEYEALYGPYEPGDEHTKEKKEC